jgi:hypothetical protein
MDTVLDRIQAIENELPENTPKVVKDLFGAANRVLFESRQKTFVESIIADLYDDVIGIIPEIGDIIGSGPRIVDALAKQDVEATLVHSTDLIVGIFYPVGYIIDLVVPGNTILKALEYYRCMEKDTQNNCLYPEGSVEKDLMSL